MQAYANLNKKQLKILLSVYFIVWSKYLTFIFKFRDQGYEFGYGLN
jgi:hypothetical protein